jgi:hypothetical protein
MKRLLTLLITTIVFGFLASTTNAGTYSGGSGTEADPYQISSVTDWQELMVAFYPDWGKSFILTTDLDLSGISITPIAPTFYTSSNGSPFQGIPFSGVFDGNGHVLHNVVINFPNNDYVGLFGYIGSTGQIRDLGVKDANITGSFFVGGIVGWNEGNITSCYSFGTVVGMSHVGGLVGHNEDGSVSSSYTTVSVNGIDDQVGGLIGINHGSVTTCYSTGSVRGTENVGGLVGNNQATITSCYATGEVNGTGNAVGGLVGYNPDGSITSSYSVGLVSGTRGAGGLVGSAHGNGVSASFWDTQASGQAGSSGGTGKTTAQMTDINTYLSAGWDFMNVWWMPLSGYPHYPQLLWQLTMKRYSGGSGTEKDPYQIASVADWQQLMTTFYDWGKSFILMADIDLAGITVTPVGLDVSPYSGNDGTPFTGVFDGNGHIIRNAVINMPSRRFLGLFGIVQYGQIKNLGVVNANISGETYIGGLVAWNAYGSIISCFFTGSVSGIDTVGGLVGYSDGNVTSSYAAGPVSGRGSVGGLVGISVGHIISCFSTGSVIGVSSVGGLVGESRASKNFNDTGNVTSSYATGTVTGTGDDVGGLVGKNDNSIVTTSYATGPVSGRTSVGGLVGYNYNGSITSSYATASVSGGDNVGGLLGKNLYYKGSEPSGYNKGGIVLDSYATGSVVGSGNYVGGFVGLNNGGNVTDCYSIGVVTGTGDTIGGLVGQDVGGSGSITSSFWNTLTSGMIYSHRGIGKTTAEMKDINTYLSAGWNFDNTWRMPSGSVNNGYPILSWQQWVQILTPNGGESCNGGATLDITWIAGGVGDPLLLKYSVDNGSSWVDIAAVSNTGSYPWAVPNTLSNTCLVKISSVDDPRIFDISDAPFSIVIPSVYFVDANLKLAVETALGVTNPTYEDMLKLTYLNAKTKGITSLIGLETALNLTTLYLHQNSISDISPLTGLNKLTVLNLYLNNITDISSLAWLTKLYSLAISSNKITDISALAGLNNLIYLYINNNQINDFSTLTGNTKFKEIYATRNAVLTEETYLNHIPAIRANNPNLKVFQYDPGCKTLRSADANQDCKVNLMDLAVIASEWLTCNHIYESMCP